MDTAASSKHHTPFPTVIGAVIALFCLVTVLVSYLLHESYQRYQLNAEETSRNLALSLNIFLKGHFQAIDLALQSAAQEFQHLHAQGRFSDERFSTYLQGLRQRLPYALSVRGTNVLGSVIYGEGIVRERLQTQKDREFFLRAREERRLIFGMPVISRITGEHVLPIVMPLFTLDGRFAGTANVNTATETVSSIFASLELGPHGVIALFDAQRRILIRYPSAPQAEDGKVVVLSAPETVAALAAKKRQASFSSLSKIDGQLRTLSLQQVGDYPIYIIVGLAHGDYLRPWWRELWTGLALLCLLAVGKIALCMAVHRRWRAEMQVEAMQATRSANEQLAAVIAAIPDSLLELDPLGRCLSAPGKKAGSAPLLGRAPEGHTVDELLPPDAAEAVLSALQEALRDRCNYGTQIHLDTEDGEKWFELSVARKDDDPAQPSLIVLSRDITDRKRAQEQIEQLAFSDTLTHLPNRRLCMDRLSQCMASSERYGTHGALLFLDLDRFKTVNDTLGHGCGDELLKQTALRLRELMRSGDTVARLGGDEFVVILEQLSLETEEAAAQAMHVAEKIVAHLDGDYELRGYSYRSTVSMGVTLFRGNETSMDELLRRADGSMYEAKGAGRNAVRFFDPQTQARVEARFLLEADLRRAIVNEEFTLFFQPQIDLDGRCIGAEALIRWISAERGTVPPDYFIPLAEETGLILLIGHWVIAEACRRLQAWTTHPLLSQLNLAVNVSPRQFSHPNFVSEVSELIAHYQTDPRRLKVEVTESMLIRDQQSVIARMNELCEMGVSFALDDFGTGYSSLAYLKRMPLSEIKIDRSFTDDILTDPYDLAICNAILAISHSMDLQVVAEGIETPEQWDCLRTAGCHFAQGFHFARPMPEAELVAWVERTNLALV